MLITYVSIHSWKIFIWLIVSIIGFRIFSSSYQFFHRHRLSVVIKSMFFSHQCAPMLWNKWCQEHLECWILTVAWRTSRCFITLCVKNASLWNVSMKDKASFLLLIVKEIAEFWLLSVQYTLNFRYFITQCEGHVEFSLLSVNDVAEFWLQTAVQ